jgi:hypothetical protein
MGSAANAQWAGLPERERQGARIASKNGYPYVIIGRHRIVGACRTLEDAGIAYVRHAMRCGLDDIEATAYLLADVREVEGPEVEGLQRSG